jgi:hypothetical protein
MLLPAHFSFSVTTFYTMGNGLLSYHVCRYVLISVLETCIVLKTFQSSRASFCDIAEPSSRLSLERAREYDRVGEILAAKISEDQNKSSNDQEGSRPPPLYGIEARRTQFNKHIYRQPVLTQKPMLPRVYRRDQPDHFTAECRNQLRKTQDYSLMTDEDGISAGRSNNSAIISQPDEIDVRNTSVSGLSNTESHADSESNMCNV